MSSLLGKYHQHLRAMEQLQAELLKLEGNTELQQEKEFVKALRDLQEEYSFSDKDTLEILGVFQNISERVPLATPKKRPSVWKYTNPHTRETVTVSRANNKLVRAWTAQYGVETVKGWRTKLSQA